MASEGAVCRDTAEVSCTYLVLRKRNYRSNKSVIGVEGGSEGEAVFPLPVGMRVKWGEPSHCPLQGSPPFPPCSAAGRSHRGRCSTASSTAPRWPPTPAALWSAGHCSPVGSAARSPISSHWRHCGERPASDQDGRCHPSCHTPTHLGKGTLPASAAPRGLHPRHRWTGWRTKCPEGQASL